MKQMANIAGFQTSLLFRASKFEDHFPPEHRSFRWRELIFNSPPETQPHRYVSTCLFFTVNQRYPNPFPQQNKTKQNTEQTSLHQRNNRVGSPWGILSLFTPRVRLRLNSPCQRLWCHRYVVFCGAGRFSYGVSPRTPPLEGTSLHRRNMSAERP